MSGMTSRNRIACGPARLCGAAAVALALLAPRAAQACAVCLSSRDDGTQLGFLIGTLIMTPLPFLVVGSLIFYLWRRARAVAAEEELIRSTSSRS